MTLGDAKFLQVLCRQTVLLPLVPPLQRSEGLDDLQQGSLQKRRQLPAHAQLVRVDLEGFWQDLIGERQLGSTGSGPLGQSSHGLAQRRLHVHATFGVHLRGHAGNLPLVRAIPIVGPDLRRDFQQDSFPALRAQPKLRQDTRAHPRMSLSRREARVFHNTIDAQLVHREPLLSHVRGPVASSPPDPSRDVDNEFREFVFEERFA